MKVRLQWLCPWPPQQKVSRSYTARTDLVGFEFKLRLTKVLTVICIASLKYLNWKLHVHVSSRFRHWMRNEAYALTVTATNEVVRKFVCYGFCDGYRTKVHA